MKIAGETIKCPNIETVVIPRAGRDFVFKAQAVLDFADFDKLCPRPKPPLLQEPGKETREDIEDKGYKSAVAIWISNKTEWMILQSLQATPDLTWDTVVPSQPETWANYIKELTDAGFAQAEIGRIIDIVFTACGLNQSKIDEATKRFLAGQVKV